jgi:hypothetical protein
MNHLDIYSINYGKKKSQESNWQFDSRTLKVGNRPNFQGELQVCFRLHPNRRSEQRIMNSENPESPNWDSFGTLPWESRDKKPFECGCRGITQRILYGESGGFPRVQAMVSLVNLKLPVACPSTKGTPEVELTNLLVGLM